MLYVFLVCSGSMICLDMNLAVKKVIDLKAEIQRITQIHILDQVLLCSGGETLLSDNIVGNYYGAGTDTNPIYLFSKNSCDPELFYDGHIKSALDPDMDYEVRNCAGMLPSIQGFTVKVALAQRFADNATRGKKECLELVHFQHLQQQGWSAVIANLEDSKESLIRRHKQFEEAYEKYLSKRDGYLGMIQQIPGDFNLLSKIPVLNRLLPLKNNTETDSEYTLLTWFCSESEDILNNFLEVTRRTLEQMDDKTLVNLKEDLVRVFQNIEDPKFTEVPGIEDRLSMLNKRTQEVAELEKNQNEIYIKFNKNMTNTKDPNVLPDLCQTFQNQLQVMLENHQRIVENLERCTKAKLELSDSINARIKHISNIHNEMINLLKFFELHEGRIKYLKKQINCFHDVHNAPERYLKLLAEVCRRKEFSIKYLKWAKHLSSNVSKLYEKEITIRKSFQSQDSKNMVDNLFSGMADMPPSYAVDCPQPFDQNLPNVFKDDLECMKDILPELSHLCEVLPTENMPWILREDSSDSAFSSNISSSQKTVSHLSKDTKYSGRFCLETGEASPCRSVLLSNDASCVPCSLDNFPSHHPLEGFSLDSEESLSCKLKAGPSIDSNTSPTSEFASLPNDFLSLASSPFEDPLILQSDLEVKSKSVRTLSHHSDVSVIPDPILEENLITDSDGEEFETVEPPVEISFGSSRHSISFRRPISSSDVSIHAGHGVKRSKAHSEGDAVSPMQDRLMSTESLASGDFQTAEFFIDDSMPSSYTESNATSPLMRGNRTVKSHHVVISEFQKQLDVKNRALACALSSVEVSPSQILKVHAKISALQKFIQDFQSGLQGDLSSLKALVKEEISARMDEACQAVGSINLYVEKLHSHLQAERDETISKAKSEFSMIEKNYQHRLEVEGQKLNDAENQISSYEEYLKMALTNNEELKQDKEELTAELDEQREVVKRMTLEYELEIDSLKDQLKEIGHKQTTEVSELQEALAHASNEIAKNKVDRHQIQIQCNENLLRHQEELFKMQEDNKKLKNNLNELNEQIHELQQPVNLVTEMELKKANEENERLLNELESLRSASESSEKREADLKELVQMLKKKHETELEDLSLRYQFVELQKLVERATSPIKEILESESIHVIKSEEDKMEHVVTKQEVGTVTDALSTEHEEEKQKLAESLQLEREEALEKLKSRLLAENQVSFNEAINRLAKEKDVTIEGLRIQISQLEAKMSTIKSCLEKYSAQLELKVSPMCKSISSSSSSSNITEQRTALGKLRNEIEKILASDYHPSSSLTRSTHPSIEILQRKFRAKEYEYQRIISKYVKSGGSLCWNCSSRLSVLSCEEGDIVLVCFEAKFKNFVIFHLGQYTHFLHPDYLQVLNLKIPDSSTVPGQGSWSLGVVQHKEFCITKKEENRYNIPIDTKFFRVKVKAWDRDAAFVYHQWHRSVHAGSFDASKSFSKTSGGMSTSSI